MHPVVLRRHGVDVALQPRVHQRGVGLHIVAWVVLPGRVHFHVVAPRCHTRNHRHHLGFAQPGEARQRRHGGSLDAVERHKNRLLRAKVHVGQQVQNAACAQPAQVVFDAVKAVEHLHVPKTHTPCGNPRVQAFVGQRCVDGGEQARRAHADGRGRRVQAVKMRAEDDGGGGAFQLLHRAVELQALFQHRTRRVPEPAAVQPSLAEINERFARQSPPFLRSALWKTEQKILLNHPTAGRSQHKQHPPDQRRKTAHPRQRQLRQEAHEENSEITEHV